MSRCQGWPECSVVCYCDDERDYEGPECAHCRVPLDELDLIETAAGLDVCSTLCGLALMTYGHRENCTRPECGDTAPLTLPEQLCDYCDQPTGGPTSHPTCKSRAMNALAYQAGALAARSGVSS